MAGLNYIQVEIFTMVTIFLGTHGCTIECPDFKCSKVGRCLFPNHARLVWVHTYHLSKQYLSISNESNGPILMLSFQFTCLFSLTNFVIRDFRHSNFLLQGWILFGLIFKIFKGDQLSNRKKKIKRKKKLRKKYFILTDG